MASIQNIGLLSVVVLITALNLAACQTKVKETEVLDFSSLSNQEITTNSLPETNHTVENSPTQKEAFTISASGIGVAKLGMTFGELKQKLGQNTEYQIKSPFMVDLDAVAVIQSGEVQYYILYLADSKFTDNSPLEILMTENPSYLTKEGVGVGTKIKQAETIYGNAKLYYNTFNESREYIRFDHQPAPNIYFRPTFSDSGFAGIYSSDNAEYNETEKFHDAAAIKLIQVICSPDYCNLN